MGNLFDRLAAVALGAKLGVLLLAVAVLGAGYWYFFYADMIDERAQLAAEAQKLSKERAEYEKRKQEYLAFRNEVSALLEEQKELLRVLPKRDDIEQFIESVQAQIELSGLSKVASVRESAVPVEMYLKIPIRMSLLGTYHQINHFFKNVGDLKRIVNIEDLSLQPSSSEMVSPLNVPNVLKANFVATTFQFVEKSKGAVGPAKGPTTSISSGGAK
jgi:type IV pilus assembly protein PilO